MAQMPIERGKIREYAVATAAARSEYLDDPHAPIPPTFLSTVVFWDSVADALGTPEAAQACRDAGVEPDVRNLLSLEQEYVFHGPLPRAGDTVFTSSRFDRVNVKEGKSGRMAMMHYALEFRDADGTLRAECLYTSAYVQAASVGGTA